MAPKPAPLPEPKSNMTPILSALLAAGPVAAYLWWLGGTLVANNEWPGWVQPGLCGGGAAFALVGVWAIVKSR